MEKAGWGGNHGDVRSDIWGGPQIVGWIHQAVKFGFGAKLTYISEGHVGSTCQMEYTLAWLQSLAPYWGKVGGQRERVCDGAGGDMDGWC